MEEVIKLLRREIRMREAIIHSYESNVGVVSKSTADGARNMIVEIEKAIKILNEPPAPGDSPGSDNSTMANLIDRLEAVATIIGGTSVPSREELDCASQELESCISQIRQ